MPNAATALDTTHVTRLPNGDFAPAPRLAYAMVHGVEALWGYGDHSDKVVGTSHIGPVPVRVPAGKTLWDVAPFSRMNGDEIRAAFACSREDYMEALQREAADALAAEQNYCEF